MFLAQEQKQGIADKWGIMDHLRTWFQG